MHKQDEGISNLSSEYKGTKNIYIFIYTIHIKVSICINYILYNAINLIFTTRKHSFLESLDFKVSQLHGLLPHTLTYTFYV